MKSKRRANLSKVTTIAIPHTSVDLTRLEYVVFGASLSQYWGCKTARNRGGAFWELYSLVLYQSIAFMSSLGSVRDFEVELVFHFQVFDVCKTWVMKHMSSFFIGAMKHVSSFFIGAMKHMSSFFYRGHETNGPFFAKQDHETLNAYLGNMGHETFSLLHFRAMKKIGVAP